MILLALPFNQQKEKVVGKIDMLTLPKTIFFTLIPYSFPVQIKALLTTHDEFLPVLKENINQ